MTTEFKPQDPRGLNQVWVGTLDVLEAVKLNYESHREVFEDALDGYQARIVELLEEHIKRVRDGKPEKVSIHIPFPEDHSEDYERVIRMLEMSRDTHLLLDQHEFAMYVMDDWGWKQQWATTTAMYTNT